jgi:hypothetical protein
MLLAWARIAAIAAGGLMVLVINAQAQAPKAVSTACPPDDRAPSVRSPVRTDERKMLVPPGVVRLTVCRYNGMNAFGGAPQWALRGAGATAHRPLIRRIIAGLDALKQTQGSYNCPFSDSSDDVVTFEYASPPGVVVTMDTGDCNTVTNGHVRRLGLGKPVVSEIQSVAKPVTRQTWAAVRGHLRLCGGPAPGRCHIESYDRSDRILVSGPNGLWIAMATIQRGRFAFEVAASGTYTFGVYAGNTLIRQLRRRVTVGRTTRVVFLIPIP